MPVLFGQQCVAPFCWRWRRRIPGWPWSCRSAIARWIWWRRDGSGDPQRRAAGQPGSGGAQAWEHGMTFAPRPPIWPSGGNLVTPAELPEHECIAYLRQGRCVGWWQEAETWREVQPRGRLQMDDPTPSPRRPSRALVSPGCRPAGAVPPRAGELRELLAPGLPGRRYPINALWPHSRICRSRPEWPSTGWRAACPSSWPA